MLRKSRNMAGRALTKRMRLLAIVVTSCLAVAACGSGDVEASGGASTLPAVPSDYQAPSNDDVPAFGDSIDEWTEKQDADASESTESQVANDYPAGYDELTWEDLVPAGFSDDDIFARYEDRLAALEDGSPEADAIYAEMQAEYNSLDSVKEELDGAKVNLAGFISPLNYQDEIVTEFLLVPYFGACIHVPAPPGNQTVLVTLDESDGIPIDDTWDAIWVAGTMSVDTNVTEIGTASYTLTDATTGIYDDFG
jgi:hypothetical protein